MRGEPNAIGVPTKWRHERNEDAYFRDMDADFPPVREAILSAFRAAKTAILEGRDVVIPTDGLGTGLADLQNKAPRIHRAIELRIKALEGIAEKNIA